MHIPWCVRKCPYCDFNSHSSEQELPESPYIDALLYDLERDLPKVWGRSISTVFIGGGTPSLFSPEAIDQLLSGLRARLPLISQAEATMEANPGTVEQGKFNQFREAGINRLSLGVQSLDDRFLKALGRIHSSEEALRAFDVARRAGFENLNLDLMFGLPGQTVTQAKEDLERAIALGPEHFSYYQLTLEPNTWFYQHPPKLPSDDMQWQMQEQGVMMLAEAGYTRYEVSAFAQKDQQCAHNLNYWEFGDYLGIGAGAHSKITMPATSEVLRQIKHRSPSRYLKFAAQGEEMGTERLVCESDISFEFFLNGLRKVEGVTKEQFEQRTGLCVDAFEVKLAELRARELISSKNDRIQCTSLGFQFLNEVISTFLPNKDTGSDKP
ncbi:MAG: radical SAM family heme chaperone HemW [Thiotrichales bacterium]